MASITHDPKGHKRIRFFDRDGKLRTIRLGKVTVKQAERVKTRVEILANQFHSADPLDPDTASWVANISDDMHSKLAAAGLARSRVSLQLGPWLDKYIAGRSDLKPGSVIKLKQTQEKLLEFVGNDKPLREITTDDAADWRQWLVGQKLSEATIRTRSRNAKTFFNAAIERELISQSPVRHLKSADVAGSNDYYVTPEETRRVIDACPNLA
ncbi:MAG: phage integrase SAM-like domain-containing protein [Planctomycetota bacterium]|nr:phage integrase SAM-like domain-containing protein [Planctomycetota bacterium]